MLTLNTALGLSFLSFFYKLTSQWFLDYKFILCYKWTLDNPGIFFLNFILYHLQIHCAVMSTCLSSCHQLFLGVNLLWQEGNSQTGDSMTNNNVIPRILFLIPINYQLMDYYLSFPGLFDKLIIIWLTIRWYEFQSLYACLSFPAYG